MKNKVLLLGYGFIGFSIARALLEDINNELYVIDRSLKIFLMKNDRITYIQDDVFNYENWIQKIPTGLDYIINCVNSNEISIDFTCNVSDTEYCQQVMSDEKALVDTVVVISSKLKIQKIIYFSSRLAELENNCVFGYCKNLIEQYIEEKQYPIYIFRLPILFGIFQDISQWPANLIWSVLKGVDMTIIDNKFSLYSWLYVADAVMYIAQYIHTQNINRKMMIIPGREISIGSFTELIQKLCGKMTEIKFSDTQQASKLLHVINDLGLTKECFEEFDERVMLAIEFIEDNAEYYKNLEDLGLIRC